MATPGLRTDLSVVFARGLGKEPSRGFFWETRSERQLKAQKTQRYFTESSPRLRGGMAVLGGLDGEVPKWDLLTQNRGHLGLWALSQGSWSELTGVDRWDVHLHGHVVMSP